MGNGAHTALLGNAEAGATIRRAQHTKETQMRAQMTKRIAAGLLAFSMLAAAPALAQDESNKGTGGDNARYQKTTQIDFEDDTIEGDLSKPDGEYVEARKRVGHEKLIRIREDFKDKVMESVSEL